MRDILAWAGILSVAAVFLREMRLMIVEARRWFRPAPPRKPRAKKEPPA
jgi:hypothetical protein